MCAVILDEKHKRMAIIGGLVGFILTCLLIFFWIGPIYIDPILSPRIEVLGLQETRLLSLKTSEGISNSTRITTTNATYQFKKNQIFTVSLPFSIEDSVIKSYTINQVLITTPGFKLNNTVPSLPVTVPSSGTLTILVHVRAPSRPYRGTLNITYYVEAEK